ncbi:ATP-binding cassette subfamily C protein CydD [Pseudoxanthomonas sp. SORGH_AS 997]|uniref:ATP-binding cassette subfamily C protein CydD n=2 Tax=Lysobacteraceae TaxID=32033 RepID=A0AAW8G7K0_9GAMM|nr:ATP-binding cassette subfamily C protein CydD [Pseudoxanthomonas winnipegensis]MDQ1134817.1 ATP-binding cassette subfamily C protein CydD [Pseudoxanthomonas winnipegensis]MDR6138951.1 ATP-binding cassette subfamily C protein CydD [Pseudoxanthomonas sp. SORGH_AS_0997]
MDAMLVAPTADAPLTLETLVAPVRGCLRLAGLATSASGVLLIAQAGLIALLAQHVLAEHRPMQTLWWPLVALLGVGLARAGLAWAARTLADDAVQALRHGLRLGVFARMQARGPLWLRGQRSGALSELTGTHIDALDGYVGGFLLARMEMVWVPLALLAAVFCVDRVVGTVLLLTLPLIPVFMALVGWGAQAASDRQLQAMARMGAHFADRLRGLGLIRLYGQASAALAGIAQAAQGVREGSLKVLRIAFLSSAVLEFFASMGVAMVALYLGLTYLGMLELRSAPLDLAAGLFCLLLAPEVYAPLRRLAAHYHDRAGALAALDGINRALAMDDAAPAPPPHADARPAPTLAPALLRVRDLRLRHAGAARAAVQGLSFDLAPGQHLALAGPSGCGKSTLLEALAGWLPPEAGLIQHASGLRIGYAPQRPHLFAGTIADNLRIAAPQASPAQLQAAADAAQVLHFARALPDGLDTRIGEGGFGLSGGQARRVALARALLQDPQLLLLDEPTAFLDADTETALLEALLRFGQGRALLVATHSAAVIERLGQVLWLGDDRTPGVRRAA